MVAVDRIPKSKKGVQLHWDLVTTKNNTLWFISYLYLLNHSIMCVLSFWKRPLQSWWRQSRTLHWSVVTLSSKGASGKPWQQIAFGISTVILKNRPIWRIFIQGHKYMDSCLPHFDEVTYCIWVNSRLSALSWGYLHQYIWNQQILPDAGFLPCFFIQAFNVDVFSSCF